MDEYLRLQYATEHHELSVKAAERAYRETQLHQDEPARAQRLLGGLGDLLARAGQRLQQDYASDMGRA